MVLTRHIKFQLAAFLIIAVTAAVIMFFGYVKLPALFGIGRYTVIMQLPQSGGLYPTSNVTYRGTEVGKVEAVHLTADGHVEAVLSLNSRGAHIPSNLHAEVHSQSAVGEQYVELVPRDSTSAPLKNGSVIALKDTSVPPPIDVLLDDANRGLQAIPHGSLKTAVDESYTAIGGLGPELSRLVKGSTALASDARANLDSLKTLIDQSAPVLDSQTRTADSVEAWASHLSTITRELRVNDTALAALIGQGASAADEGRRLVERLQPTLPLVLANLVSVGNVAVVYQPAIEQLLVLIPQGVAVLADTVVPNRYNKSPYAGGFLDFDLNFNLPPPCVTGYLPPQQRRPASMTDAPDRPPGDLYCRTPQDSPFDVRGAKNLPCLTRPGKRAPTVKMCESDEQYVPLNDGYNWKGDPNATASGQAVPQPPPGAPAGGVGPPPAPPPLAVAHYDPSTGSYVGPDGRVYTQSDLANNAPKEKTWQSMMIPPAQN